MSRHEQALDYCQRALTLHQQLGEREGAADAWDSLGYAHHHLGHLEHAIPCYQHALDLFRKLGNRYYEANTLTHLANTQNDADDLRAATQSLQQALDILEELHHPDAEQIRAKLDQLDGT